MPPQNLILAYQGKPGAFSHIAACQLSNSALLPSSCDYVSCQSFAHVFTQVTNGAYGVLPIENSTYGSIIGNYDLLFQEPVQIEGEIILPIHHQLLGLTHVKLGDIVEVHSHPAALGQCSKFFQRFPGIKAVDSSDTSGAALFVKQCGNRSIAAIASVEAAREHQLEIIEQNIEDYPHNCTRFVLIRSAHKESLALTKSTNVPVKLSIAYEFSDSLSLMGKLIQKLVDFGCILSKIESRPVVEHPWQYRIFLDFKLKNWNMYLDILPVLQEDCSGCKFLGTYQTYG